MQLVTIDSREVAGRPGVVTAGGEILDLFAAPSTLDQAQWIPQSVVSVLAAGEDGRERVQRLLDSAAQAHAQSLRDAAVLLPFEQTSLMAPVRRPGLLLVTESLQAAAGEPDPVAYIKSPNTAIGHDHVVRVPWRADDGLLIRPLLGAVLGRPLHRANAGEAAATIAAYTLLLDLSRPHPERGSGAAAWRSYLDSKQFPGACPIGPALITRDEFDPDNQVELSFLVNDVAVSQGRLALTAFPELLARLSTRYGFRPGDVIGLDLFADQADGRRYQPNDRVALALGGQMRLEIDLHF